MARTPAPGTRDRILDSATRLFQQHGARAVGTQQIIDDCGCGKNLLYREFQSKDDLVVAYLERCQREWAEIMDEATRPCTGDPAGQLVALVRAAAHQVADPAYQGCPFRTTHAQFPDGHPAREITVRHVEDLRDRLIRLGEQARARDPRDLADRLRLIINGIYVDGSVLGPQGATRAAVTLAEQLVNDATAAPS